jgi:hypothetical protein
MAQHEQQVMIHPCTYEDKTFYEDDFDRESGRMYYTKYSSHEYTIKVDHGIGTTDEHVFEIGELIEDLSELTIDKLKELSKGSFNIIKYNNSSPGRRTLEQYSNGKLSCSEAQALDDGSWIRDGVCLTMWGNPQTNYYKMNKSHGWHTEYRKDDIIQRLFEDDICLGYRIIKDGKVEVTNISEENMAKFPEQLPSDYN